MRKWRIKSRKILATLLAAVMLLVMIPTTMVDTAAADMTYVEQDGWFYFWDEQGLKDILTANADSEWVPMRFAASQSELDDSTGTMTLNSSVTIPAKAYVHMRDGQLKVTALRKLTVQGTLVTRVDRAVTGSVSVEGDGVYCKYSDVTDGVSLVSELKKLGNMAAAGDVAKNLEVSVMADVTVNGDLTVPAGVYMYLDEGKTLQVSGALTVEKDAAVGDYGVLKAVSVNIEQGGSMSYGEGAELDYGSQLTVNGEFYGFGTVRGTGSQPSIVIGGTAEIDNYGAGSISADVWSVNAAATINNYGVLVVPLAQRASLVSGTNISYNAKDGDNGTGSVQYAVRLTDTEAGKAGVLQNAINTFDTITDKKDYELFAVSVSNAAKGQPMQLTLNENVTLDGAADCLFLTQNDWPEDETGFAPHVTIGEGAALTVAAGRTLSANVPVTVNGTLDIRSEGSFTFGTPGIVVLQDGMTVNGTVLTAGLLEVSGDVIVAEGGVLHQTMGGVRIEGSLTVNGTMTVDMVDFQIKGSYTKGANATVTIGENANFSYQAKTTFNKDAILAAFAQEDVSTVTVEVNEDVTLTENLTIPKGKTLVIDGYGTLTIAPGATLALEGTVEADWEKDIDGGQLKCGAPMVIRGTFSVGNEAYANPDGDVSVENDGKLIMAGSAYFGGRSFVVKAGGHVTNNGWMSFTEGAAITVEDDWAAVWTQGEGAETNIDVVAALEQGDNADQKIQKALADINASTLPDFFSYTLSVYRQDDGERIELTQDVTIPTGVMLAFYNEGVTTYIAEGTALTIQGGLYSDAPITVDGKLTVSASGYANVHKNLLVGGTLTIDEGGRMYCRYLTDENEQGTAGKIINNGSLSAEQLDLKHNEVDIGGGDDGSKVVRSLEALKSALAEGGQINYRGTELTISEDLTIPENVNLTINVTTFTVNEGVTLTNKGNVTLYGNAYLYGKLDVSSGNGYFGGNGVVKAGGEDNLVGDEYGNRQFNWTARISKEGTSETLTQEELTAAGASALADGIEIDLGSQTTLTLADGLEIRDKNVSIGGTNAAKVVVNGTLSVWNYLNLDAPMELNGTVDVYGSVYASRDITVNTSGKLRVRNYYDESEHRQWTGSVEFGDTAWIALPEGTAWDNYVTVDDGCNLCVNKSVRMSELESFLQSCNDGRKYMVTLRVEQHQGESIPVYFATGTTVVIPKNVELRINNLTYRGYSAFVIGAADESGKKGEVIVNGSLRISMPAQVDGTLTINGKLWAFGGATTTVNGALTVSEGANMSCNRLAGTGTITNNGTLTANEKAVGTVIGGSGKITIYNTRLEASNMAELKAALSSLSGSTERQTIYLCRSAMNDANPYFVIDGDITVPSGVELRMDEMRSSNFRGLTVAENAKLTLGGEMHIWPEEGVTVYGTMETLGGQAQDGNWQQGGYLKTGVLTVEVNARFINGGNTSLHIADRKTDGFLTVKGTMENKGELSCQTAMHSGVTFVNDGSFSVTFALQISEGSTIQNNRYMQYGDCDALDKIVNSEGATIHWQKYVTTIAEMRALLTRTDEGTIILWPQGEETLTEDLAIPGNIELVFAADHGQTPTLTVSEGVTLSANGQLNIQDSATLAVNGTLATCNNVQVYGTLIISESGVWKQKNSASVNNDGASITINGRLEQSESWVELTSWRNGKIIFGANAHWNEVGTISSRESSTAITGFDTGKYKLSTNDGINYYLERLSSGGGSGGGETSTIGDVNGDGVVDQADLVALARFMAGIDDLEDTTRADINGDGIYSAADLTALARMLEAQQGTQTADADENGAPVDTGAELNADAQDTVQTEDGGAPVEPAPVVDDVPETVEESVAGEVPQTEAGEQAA